MEERDEEYTYFVFSDEIQWCKENRQQLSFDNIKGDLFFVEENRAYGRSYIDMQLMSCCKNMIMSDSTFGIWSFYLNEDCRYENMINMDKL